GWQAGARQPQGRRRRLLAAAPQRVLGRLGSPRWALPRPSAPPLPPRGWTVRGLGRPRIGGGARPGGEARRGAPPPFLPRPRRLRHALPSLLDAGRGRADQARRTPPPRRSRPAAPGTLRR